MDAKISNNPRQQQQQRYQSNQMTIQNVESILEKFFHYHITYQWDKAKDFIEHERDQFRIKNLHQILTTMLHYLAQLILADRNYLTLQFFSNKVFQRKDLLKSTYEHLRTEFQRLEERSNQLFLRHNFYLLPFQSSPIHSNQNNNNANNEQQNAPSIGSSITSINDATAAPTVDLLNVEESVANDSITKTTSEPAKEALDFISNDNENKKNDESNMQQSTIIDSQEEQCEQSSVSLKQYQEQLSSDLTRDQIPATKSNFFSKLFRRFSSRDNQQQQQSSNSNKNNTTNSSEINISVVEAEELLSKSMAPPPPPLSSSCNDSNTSNHLDSLDQFAGHLCGQLLIYCKVRVEMIDFYERLSMTPQNQYQLQQQQQQIKKFIQLDDYIKMLNDINLKVEDSLHHPVLNRLKLMFMYECNIILSLLRCNQLIKQWNYLDSLFALQYAHDKILRLAYPKDYFIITNNINSPTNSAQQQQPQSSPASVNGEQQQAINSSSLSSSSGSSNLSVPNSMNVNNNNRPLSPLSSNIMSFVYPTGGNAQQQQQQSPSSTSSSSATASATKFLFRSTTSGQSSSSPTTLPHHQQQQQNQNSSSTFIDNNKSVPSLIQWFNRFQLFLLSKYSFYFHSLLMIHLTPFTPNNNNQATTITSKSSSTSLSSLITLPSLTTAATATSTTIQNYQQTDNYMRNLFGKFCNQQQQQQQQNHLSSKNFINNQFLFDHHTKIIQFIRKINQDHSSYQINFVIIWNTSSIHHQSKSDLANHNNDSSHGNSISLTGYRSPYIDNAVPQGRCSLPIIYSYPLEFNMNRHPSLIMIMEANSNKLDNSDMVVVEYDQHKNESSNNLNQFWNGMYFLVRPDQDMTIALIIEAFSSTTTPTPLSTTTSTSTIIKRLLNEREQNYIQSFMYDLSLSLREIKILQNFRMGKF